MNDKIELVHYQHKTKSSGSIMDGDLFVTNFFCRVEKWDSDPIIDEMLKKPHQSIFYASVQISGSLPKYIGKFYSLNEAKQAIENEVLND